MQTKYRALHVLHNNPQQEVVPRSDPQGKQRKQEG
jgi:hypothetical protein